MKKIQLIIAREYITRVKTRAFILLTLLAPVLYGLLIMIPILASRSGEQSKQIAVVDESGIFHDITSGDKNLVFYNENGTLAEAQKGFVANKENYYILHIPKDFDIFNPKGVEMFSSKNAGIGFKSAVDSILENRIRDLRMAAYHIPKARMDSLHVDMDIPVRKVTEKGIENSSSGANTAAAFAGGFLIYIFIFLYGTMVTRGVQEEKQSRVVEIIISSVKPFQLMMGKIIGIALVGLTQFAMWIILTMILTTITGQLAGGAHAAPDMHGMHAHMGPGAGAGGGMAGAVSALSTLHLPILIALFLFYFLAGYLLYSSFFAAVASAVDSASDMSQFMLPISLPIIFSFAFISNVVENPDGPIAFWLSMVPLTSPIIMMARVPFLVDSPGGAWQIILSMVILILSFICSTWMAGKIYRIGILMYGKKTSWKELGKWLFYKG